MNKLIVSFLLLLLFGCGKSREKELAETAPNIGDYSRIANNLLNQSALQVPLDYPVADLQRMMNRIMPGTLVNDSINLNDKGDYLVLKVMPIGNLLLSGYQNNLDASIPVQALVYLKKKLVAFNFKNKKPIVLKLRFDLHTVLSINEQFDLNTQCAIRKIHWIEAPEMTIAGVKINLKNTIDKQLEKNAAKIEAAICQAIDKAVPIQKEVQAIWKLLNTTHRVAKNPINIWLTMVPTDFSAQFDNQILDTLRVIIHAKTGVLITPLKGIELKETKALPVNKNFVPDKKLQLKVSVNMPYEYINFILNSQLQGQEITYAGLSAELTNFRTTSDTDRLKLEFTTKGDLELHLESEAKPTLNNKKELIFDELKYKVVSDNVLVNSLDWLSNSAIDSYLLHGSKIPLAHILDSLDSKIVQVLDRSKLSTKLGLKLDFEHIEPDTILYYPDRFEWIFSVEGHAHAYLSDSLVHKN